MSDIRNEGEAAAGPEAEGVRPGQGTRPVDPSRPCRNCGDPTPGEYCPTCGQRKVDVRVSLKTLLMEVLEDQFILDRRLPRTLGALLFRPGHLTVEHVHGRIVRYIHPFRLYLVSSLIFFVLLSFVSLELVRQTLARNGPRVEIGETAGAEEAASVDEALAELRLQLADTARGAAALEGLRETEAELLARRRQLRLDSLTTAVADLTATLNQIDQEAADTTLPPAVRNVLVRNRSMFETELAAASGRREALLSDTLPGDSGAAAVPATVGGGERPLGEVFGWTDGDGPTIQVGIAAADSVLEDQVDRIGAMTPREAADTLLGTFFNYVPTMMFILLPVFAGVLKLLYIRRRRFYAEHFVFLLHVHSMVYILAVVMLLLHRYVGTWLDILLIGWILIYIYLAMKRVYGQGWFKTLVKYWTLGWAYFWILLVSIPFALIATLLLF